MRAELVGRRNRGLPRRGAGIGRGERRQQEDNDRDGFQRARGSEAPAVFNALFSIPIAEAWLPLKRPQRILVLAPMYHVNAFATVHSMLTGDRLFSP